MADGATASLIPEPLDCPLRTAPATPLFSPNCELLGSGAYLLRTRAPRVPSPPCNPRIHDNTPKCGREAACRRPEASHAASDVLPGNRRIQCGCKVGRSGHHSTLPAPP